MSLISKNSIANVPREITLFLGLKDPNVYADHALGVTSATALADEGADILALKRHGCWVSNAAAEEYVRESKHTQLDISGKLTATQLTLSVNYNQESKGQSGN